MDDRIEETTSCAIWDCKIGETTRSLLPPGADSPMRKAVAKAYEEITGVEPDFIFSGWGATLTEGERAVVENRMPMRSEGDMVRDAAPDLLKALQAAQALATCCMAPGCYSHEEIEEMARATKPTFDAAIAKATITNPMEAPQEVG